MLIENEQINLKNFQIEFQKKFKNFCNKAPILLSFIQTPQSVMVHELFSDEIKSFEFDFKLSVKENIKIIKDWLCENKYPVLIELVKFTEDYSAQELNKMLEQNKIKIDDINTVKKVITKKVFWRIERLIVNRDEFFVRNLDDNKVYWYKLKMPSIIFLKKIRENKINLKEAWDIFYLKAELLKVLD